jgi:ATP-binding cassette subfamily F protein 3
MARAREVLVGLGFAPDALDGPVTALSGGWWMRVELARLLLVRPDYLLLDEPTNHLDNDSLAFLENFLERYPGAWVVVSHDRYFLNRRVTRIAELTSEGLVSFPGNYDDFVEARDALSERLEATARNQQRKRDELTAFVDRFGAKASKAKQAQSRVKQLERMAPPPPPQRKARTLRFRLPQPRRAGEWLVRLEKIHKQYGDKVIYHDLDMEIRRGDRIALVGVNGAGKSTLLKLLADAVTPDAGRRQVGHNVDTYYFAQHQLDILDANKTVLQEMQDGMPPMAPISQVRGILGAFLFGQDSVEKQVRVLSGGEKSRLVLAKMLAVPSNLLLLDEPTNHLDLASRDMLEAALAQFEGTLVCISHDRYFVNRIATKIVEVQPGGSVHVYDGNFDAYTWRKQQAAAAAEAATSQAATPGKVRATQAAAAPQDNRNFGARKAERREEMRRQKKQQALEEGIAAAEARLKAIDGLLCDPDVYADAARCKDLMAEREALDSSLGEQMATWEGLNTP